MTLEEFIAKLSGKGSNEARLTERFPAKRIKEIKRKELRRYKAAQDKKWENWLDKVSK